MCCKKLLLVKSEILGLLVNTFTADDKYSRHNIDNFSEQVEMQLSQNLKSFSGFFIKFQKSTSNCDYFEEKDGSHSLSISQIIHFGKRWLLKRLKCPFSGNASPVIVLTCPQHC